jgi:hypothetical protein
LLLVAVHATLLESVAVMANGSHKAFQTFHEAAIGAVMQRRQTLPS